MVILSWVKTNTHFQKKFMFFIRKSTPVGLNYARRGRSYGSGEVLDGLVPSAASAASHGGPASPRAASAKAGGLRGRTTTTTTAARALAVVLPASTPTSASRHEPTARTPTLATASAASTARGPTSTPSPALCFILQQPKTTRSPPSTTRPILRAPAIRVARCPRG